MRLRAMFAGFAPRSILLIAGFAFVATVGFFFSAMTPLTDAKACSEDWEEAIAAVEAGATEFSQGCVSFGGLPAGDTTLIDDFHRSQTEADQQVLAELDPISTDIWGFAATNVAGLPLVISAVLLGALGVGSMLGSGTTAWCLSNGWDRKTWIRSVITLTAICILVLFAVLTLGFGAATVARVNLMGLPLSLGAPGWTLVAPIPGLLLYAALGITTGLVVARGETAALTGLLIAAAEYIGSAIAGWSFLPSVAYQTTLGSGDTTASPWTTGVALLVGAAVLTGITYLIFVYRRNVPDRPA